MPKASVQPPVYFRDNIRHLFWRHERRAIISCYGGPHHHHRWRLSSGGQPKVQIFSWPLCELNTIILFVYKLLDNEWFLIGENQIRQFTTFGQPKQFFGSYESTFLLCFGKILHFLDLQWLFFKFIFQYLLNGILGYVPLKSYLSATAMRIAIKSLLYFSKHFCWCSCFFRALLWRRAKLPVSR